MKAALTNDRRDHVNDSSGSPVPVVQTKLTVGAANDKYEQEADSMADKVTQSSEPNFVQRKCEHCAEEEKGIQRKSQPGAVTPVTAGAGVEAGAALGGKINETRGSGQSLDDNTKSFMENRFAADFGGVRVHTGSDAIQMSQELNAKAFTTGNDIYFNEGEYQPQSPAGRHLLAHELTHTIQQNTGGQPTVQRAVKDKRCYVYAYDNSDPKDKAVVYQGKPVPHVYGVSSVDNLVTKTNDYINDKGNSCNCVAKLEINGHGTDGYQSVGNGVTYSNDDKALVYNSAQEHIEKLKGIKFCDTSMLVLGGCHVGQSAKGKELMKRVSNTLPGVLVGGAEHFTIGGYGKKRVVDDDKDVDKKNNVDPDKTTDLMKSKHVRWYFTGKDGQEYTTGTDADPADVEMKLKTADKVKVVTPDGEVIKIK